MCSVLCDRTPKLKSKEELDREGRTGVQAETDEGDERVKTESLLLKSHFSSIPIWSGHVVWGRALGSNPALPPHGATLGKFPNPPHGGWWLSHVCVYSGLLPCNGGQGLCAP